MLTIETKEQLSQPVLEDLDSRYIDTSLFFEPAEPVDVASLPGDRECINKAQANLRAQKIGDVALGKTVEAKTKPVRSIYEAMLWAKEGDGEAREMIRENVKTEALERIFKAGIVLDARLQTDSQNRILQNGQLVDDVYRNAYQMASADPIIAERTVAEANNGARIKNLLDEGKLEDNVFVVFSRCPDDISDERLDDLNFFSRTKSLSIQATTLDNDGLHTESAFVAGVKNPKDERHDKETIERIGELFGLDYSDKSATEIIDMPVLIPKKFIKNGVIDLVKLYDELNDGTFYGQDVKQQDYLEHKQFCQDREASFDNDIETVVDQLIEEFGPNNDAIQVCKRLAKLVQDRMVKRALKDDSIDEFVFGDESAEHINHARFMASQGEYDLARQHSQIALNTATGGSCPSALKSVLDIQNANNVDDESEKEKLSWHGGRIKKGECVNCHENTYVGVANWCRSCIKC